MHDITIISGGQTGVDRGALDAALAARNPCGGWLPEGRKAEDGPLPKCYPLAVLPGAGYIARTRRNVIDSDATVIVYFGSIQPRSGTAQTIDEALKAERPHLVIDGAATPPEAAAEKLNAFCLLYAVTRLNVAGPRASLAAGGHDYALRMIGRLIALRRCE